MPKIDFSEVEIQAMIKMIDSAVRQDGLNAAMNAVILVQKLQGALNTPPPPKEK